MDRGIEVVLVSSGAIGAGMGLLKMQKKSKSLSELQAIASVGQNHLMDIYNDYLNKRSYTAGQILLTQEDLNDRKRFLNIRYTLNALLKYKAVPIVNENDSVSTDEIKFGDNDRLSSLVADLAGSDLLVILTDVDGLYDGEGKVLRRVKSVNKDVRSLCRGKGCEVSTGGMITKLEAVKNATHAGIQCVVAKGRAKNVLIDIVDGKEVGTFFTAKKKALKAKKRWIAFGLKPRGRITVDDGAAKALTKSNRSLLPSGIIASSGMFSSGDVVLVEDKKGREIARGVTNYSTSEIDKIKGLKTNKIEEALGYKDYDEVLHRDNLVVIDED